MSRLAQLTVREASGNHDEWLNPAFVVRVRPSDAADGFCVVDLSHPPHQLLVLGSVNDVATDLLAAMGD